MNLHMYLEQQENAVKDKVPYLAYQVHLYSMERAQVNSLHMSRYLWIPALPET